VKKANRAAMSGILRDFPKVHLGGVPHASKNDRFSGLQPLAHNARSESAENFSVETDEATSATERGSEAADQVIELGLSPYK